MQPFSKTAWVITFRSFGIFCACDPFTAGHDVVNVKSKEPINDVALAVHVKDGELVILLGCQAHRDVDAAVQLVLEQSDVSEQGFVCRLIPLSRRSDVTEGWLCHLHDFVLLQADQLHKETSHICRGFTIDLDLLMDVVALQKGTFHIHGANAPSLAAGHEHPSGICQVGRSLAIRCPALTPRHPCA